MESASYTDKSLKFELAGLITESAIVHRYKICQTNPAMEGCPASSLAALTVGN